MADYSRGKIYRVTCNNTGNQYIGSTTALRLSQRLAEHKSKFKRGEGTSCDTIIGGGNYKIFLIEDFPCQNKDQLRQRERYYQENLDCINKNKSITSTEEKSEYNRRYTSLHRERYLELNKIVKLCECGSEVQTGHYARHKESKKHLNYINKEK